MQSQTYKKEFVVLLTATIDPGPYTKDLTRNNPEIRLEDYRKSLLFWSGLCDKRIKGIVFCDNSGADLDVLKKACLDCSNPTEFLSFEGNSKPFGVHYGYAELGIIDYAVRQSVLMSECQYFIKTTGRLTFPNISKLLDSIDCEFDAAVDHRKKYKREQGFPVKARTQLMFFSKKFYGDHLLNSRDEMIGFYSHIEEFLAAKLDTFKRNSRIVRRFNVECPPMGFNGWRSKNYRSFLNVSKNTLRAFMRKAFPSVWF